MAGCANAGKCPTCITCGTGYTCNTGTGACEAVNPCLANPCGATCPDYGKCPTCLTCGTGYSCNPTTGTCAADENCTTSPCMAGCPNATTCNCLGCASVPNSTCNSATGLCECNAGYHPNGSVCEQDVVEPIILIGAFTAPTTVAPNSEFTVTQVVSNSGNAPGDVTMTFTAGGETQVVTAVVPAGGSVTLTATFVAPASEGDTLVVSGSLNAIPTGSKTVTVSTSSGIGTILAVVGIALIGGFILMSGKSTSTPSTPVSDSGGLPPL